MDSNAIGQLVIRFPIRQILEKNGNIIEGSTLSRFEESYDSVKRKKDDILYESIWDTQKNNANDMYF